MGNVFNMTGGGASKGKYCWSLSVPQLLDTRSFSNTVTDTRQNLQFYAMIFNNGSYVAVLDNTWIYNTGRYIARVKANASGNEITFKHNGATADIIFFTEKASITNGHIYIISIDYNGVNPTVRNGLTANNIMLFDLTEMYGAGNEPTQEQFWTAFPNSYYSKTDIVSYTLSDNSLAYPDGAIYNRYYYKKIAVLGDLLKCFGCSKYAVDEFVPASTQYNLSGIAHSLGVVPKVAFLVNSEVWLSNDSSMQLIGGIYGRNSSSTYPQSLYGTEGTTNYSYTGYLNEFTSNTLRYNGHNGAYAGMLITGKKYYLLTMA